MEARELFIRSALVEGEFNTRADWDISKLTPHMLMNFKVVNDKGDCVAMGRDLCTRPAFEQCLSKGRQNLWRVAAELCTLVQDTLAQHHQINQRLKGGVLSNGSSPSVLDINEQLKQLIYSRFINQTPGEWLKEFPRYFKAITLRLEKLAGGEPRDRQNVLEIKPLWQAYLDRKQKHDKQGIVDAELETYRWMIEELRVSLFAQELKTKMPVSVQRLKKQWERAP